MIWKNRKLNEKKIYMGTITKLYEAKVLPLLRLFHIMDISPSGWIRLKKFKKVTYKPSNCNYNFTICYKDIEALNDKETQEANTSSTIHTTNHAVLELCCSANHAAPKADIPATTKPLPDTPVNDDAPSIDARIKRRLSSAFSCKAVVVPSGFDCCFIALRIDG